MSGSFIRDDEELREDMSPAERERVLVLRRLRQEEDRRLRMCLVTGQKYAREGDKFVYMRSCIDIEVDQVSHLAGTSSSIRRKLVIITTPVTPESENIFQQLGQPDPSAIVRAKKEAKEILARILVFHKEYTKFDLIGLKYKVLYDAKGLNSSVRKGVTVKKSEDSEDIVMVRSVDLAEAYETKPPDIDPENINGIARKDREKALRLAREEIQGALEFAFVKVPSFRPLGTASTGILDVIPSMECEHCGFGHRNGDCELMLVHEIFTDTEVPEGQDTAGAALS
ncbi:hypothetical protein EG329_003589 [Mollisiaceae sp. DMI_Dod_QoI]|nr:hypothetical protein EG329_003589 [Helotiales sp. DMI_Dod_QoI]